MGTLQLAGMKLNFLNIAVIPLIMGLGMDNGIHILQRYYEGGRRDLESAVEQSGRAIVVTSLATILAFGTLSFASFPGIREIGIVAMMGSKAASTSGTAMLCWTSRGISSSPSVQMATTGPPRACTCSMFDMILGRSACFVATATVGNDGSMSAMGPCFISPAAYPSAWM